MKKLFILLFVIIMCTALCSCTNNTEIDKETTTTTQQTEEITYGNDTETASDDYFTDRDLSGEYNKDSAVVVKLKDNATTANGSGIKIDGNTITVTEEQVYYFTGSLSNGMIIVDAEDMKVQLVFDNVTINNNTSASVYIKSAKKAFITLAQDTTSTLSNKKDFVAIDEENIDAVIYAKDDITINGTGTLNINSKYGHAIAANDDLKITNGNININAAKKAIKANDSVRITRANITISAETDGIHCDEYVYIKDGTININKCNEGIEGKTITIDGGTINIISSDDGLNATSGSNDSNNNQFGGNPFEYDSEAQIYINGGKLTIKASGDGIDSNGDITVTGGYTIVYGPENDGNAAIDYGGDGIISGGTVVALGKSGMAQGFSNNSTQCAMLVNLSNNFSTNVILKDSKGNEIINAENSTAYNSVVISSPDIIQGETYTLTTGKNETEIEMTDIIYSNSQGMGMGNSMDKPQGMGGGFKGGPFGQ